MNPSPSATMVSVPICAGDGIGMVHTALVRVQSGHRGLCGQGERVAVIPSASSTVC
jgi:hypothetical protein